MLHSLRSSRTTARRVLPVVRHVLFAGWTTPILLKLILLLAHETTPARPSSDDAVHVSERGERLERMRRMRQYR